MISAVTKAYFNCMVMHSSNVFCVAQGKRDKTGANSAAKVSITAPTMNTSPLLVPYEFLTEKEKASSVHSAMEMIRTILYLNYRFERDSAFASGGT